MEPRERADQAIKDQLTGGPKAPAPNVPTIDDGGPAFPRPASTDERRMIHYGVEDGMTLRDYFAAQALAVIPGDSSGGGVDDLADDAYRIADAMIRRRQR